MTDERFGVCPDRRPEAQAIWEEMKSGVTRVQIVM